MLKTCLQVEMLIPLSFLLEVVKMNLTNDLMFNTKCYLNITIRF